MLLWLIYHGCLLWISQVVSISIWSSQGSYFYIAWILLCRTPLGKRHYNRVWKLGINYTLLGYGMVEKTWQPFFVNYRCSWLQCSHSLEPSWSCCCMAWVLVMQLFCASLIELYPWALLHEFQSPCCPNHLGSLSTHIIEHQIPTSTFSRYL